MMRLQFAELRVPFTTSFRHASAERRETSTAWVTAVAESGVVGHGEGCPRPYVTGETIASAGAFFEAHCAEIEGGVHDLATLRAWMRTHAAEIDDNPAAWCAIELAVLDVLGRSVGQTLEGLLGRPALTGRFRYTAVIGDADPEAFSEMARRFARSGFTDFKIKLSGDRNRDRPKVDALQALGLPTLRLRVDANNLWSDPDTATAHLHSLECPLFAVEEPLRARQHEAFARIGEALGTRIVLDESLTRVADLEPLAAYPERWIANVRVSKMGGVLRSLDLVAEASRLGLPIIVGAQVGESSVLTRAALTVASAAGPRLVGQEGAFGTHLLTRDVCDPPLMFGAGGVLDVAGFPALAASGLGLNVD
jgi:L-alanine-DL-glutamate epimerase-like enolase superfamily enzyme